MKVPAMPSMWIFDKTVSSTPKPGFREVHHARTLRPARGVCPGAVSPALRLSPISCHRPRNRPRCAVRSEEHTSELQSLMRISYAVFCLKKKNKLHIYHN